MECVAIDFPLLLLLWGKETMNSQLGDRLLACSLSEGISLARLYEPVQGFYLYCDGCELEDVGLERLVSL